MTVTMKHKSFGDYCFAIGPAEADRAHGLAGYRTGRASDAGGRERDIGITIG